VPAGSPPTLVNSSGSVVNLANANRVAGLDIEPENSQDAMVGSGVNGLTVDSVGIETSRGGAANGGISLVSSTGILTFDQLSITGAGSGTAFALALGDPQITVTASSLAPTGGSLLAVSNLTGGSIDFQASNALSLSGGAGDAVSLLNNAATITIADLGSLSTGSGGGLLITNSGTVNLGTLADITATGGPTLDITTTAVTSLGGGALTFSSLSSTGSPNRGVSLDGVAPALTVSGTTTVASSTGDGIVLSGTNGAVIFASVGPVGQRQPRGRHRQRRDDPGHHRCGFAQQCFGHHPRLDDHFEQQRLGHHRDRRDRSGPEFGQSELQR